MSKMSGDCLDTAEHLFSAKNPDAMLDLSIGNGIELDTNILIKYCAKLEQELLFIFCSIDIFPLILKFKIIRIKPVLVVLGAEGYT